MNENNIMLIGTPVNVTAFAVVYQYTKAPRIEKNKRTAKADDDKVVNEVVVVTGDPSGRDIFDIAQRLVLGPNPYKESDFRVIQQRRVFDAMGLASVTTWDKLDGQAPETPGVVVDNDDEEDGPNDDGSIPPVSNLN